MLSFNFWLTQRTRLDSFLRADKILIASIEAALKALAKPLQAQVRDKVRVFTGREKRGVKTIIMGRGLNRQLWVYGELAQHFIDELGLPPGTFPNWAVGSPLYNYARRKIKTGPTATKGGPKSALGERTISHVKSRQSGAARRKARAAATKGKRTRRPRARAAGRTRTGGTRQGRKLHPSTRARLRREAAVGRFAFLIARAVFERGIKPGEPFKRTLEANRAMIISAMKRAVLSAVAQINTGHSAGGAGSGTSP